MCCLGHPWAVQGTLRAKHAAQQPSTTAVQACTPCPLTAKPRGCTQETCSTPDHQPRKRASPYKPHMQTSIKVDEQFIHGSLPPPCPDAERRCNGSDMHASGAGRPLGTQPGKFTLPADGVAAIAQVPPDPGRTIAAFGAADVGPTEATDRSSRAAVPLQHTRS